MFKELLVDCAPASGAAAAIAGYSGGLAASSVATEASERLMQLHVGPKFVFLTTHSLLTGMISLLRTRPSLPPLPPCTTMLTLSWACSRRLTSSWMSCALMVFLARLWSARRRPTVPSPWTFPPALTLRRSRRRPTVSCPYYRMRCSASSGPRPRSRRCPTASP